jgi:hypothetical protein
MSLIDWTMTEIPGGAMFASEIVEDYEIRRTENKFYVVRHVEECQDIGPLPNFNDAEDVIIQMASMLTEFEEQAWRILAATALSKAGLITLQAASGASEVEDAEIVGETNG